DIGGCYFNLENYTEAFSWFRKSLERNPQNATAHYGLGLCYHHTGDSLRSLHHYFEAIKLKPDYTEAYNNIASVSINQESDYKTGIEMLKKGIENCSDESVLTMIYLNLSRAYNTLGEFALADHYKAEYLKSWGFDFIIEEDDDDDD
ncbi:MAG TPA: tetratricopeptide repeat protein, partial [Bacteroidales bacterium]|nr:tetratricopeptide repeat protein [Bacteroidales bacterium]